VTPSGPIPSRDTPPPPARPAQAAAPPAQTAALPPAGVGVGGSQVSLPFSGEAAELTDAAKRQLDQVATRANRDESARLQLLAYASGAGDAASRARRLSLSRALAVRSYLIDKGVRSTRIDVRALGNRLEGGGDPDRVDVIVAAR
jgi:outer membrane protein OmpA-like peptidoglycan-associated protein